MRELELQFHKNEEYLLDLPFTAEEVSRALSKLKKKKAPGPDDLLAEHLKAGGRGRSCGDLADEYSQCYSRVGICIYSFEEGYCHSCV